MPSADRRPFVDRPVGDLAVATEAAGLAAHRWDLPEPALLRVGMNAIFTAGDVVLRAGRPSVPGAAAFDLAATLSGHGVRVARPARDDVVVHDGITVTAWERLVADPVEMDWREVGRTVALLHRIDPSALPATYPCPPCTSFPWWRFDELLDEVGPLADDRARAGLAESVDRHRGWDAIDERRAVVCHGDVHWNNVVMTADGPVVIDWDLLCHGPPAWDHAPLITAASRWGCPASWYEEFAAGYGVLMLGDPVAEAFAELRLVAATLMRLRAGRDDPAAMPEAQRRLAHWRGDPDAPMWTAV